MDPFAIGRPDAGGPATADPNALSATPYVYLIPTGADVLRTPPVGNGGLSITRVYPVQDFAMPLPFNIGGIPYSPDHVWAGNETLNNEFLRPRQHQAFRAVDDPAFFLSGTPEAYTNNRLVGRSAWNTGWKLVVPAHTLLNNPSEGLDRFLKSVTDIKLYLRTYSYSGN